MADDLHENEVQVEPNRINQASLVPTSKVASGGLAGGLTVVLVFVAGQMGLEIPAEVASAITTVIAFAASYFIKDKEIL